jgi:hypothetical protein
VARFPLARPLAAGWRSGRRSDQGPFPPPPSRLKRRPRPNRNQKHPTPQSEGSTLQGHSQKLGGRQAREGVLTSGICVH